MRQKNTNKLTLLMKANRGGGGDGGAAGGRRGIGRQIRHRKGKWVEARARIHGCHIVSLTHIFTGFPKTKKKKHTTSLPRVSIGFIAGGYVPRRDDDNIYYGDVRGGGRREGENRFVVFPLGPKKVTATALNCFGSVRRPTES